MDTNTTKKAGRRSITAHVRQAGRNRRLLYTLILLGLVIIGVLFITHFVAKAPTRVTPVTDSPVVRQYRSKLPALKAAAEKKPTDFTARQSYAQALYVTGDKQSAKREYEAAIKLNPKDATIRNNLANTYRDLGDTTAAVSAYRAAFSLDPTLINAYVNLATVQAYTLQKPGDAVATYKLAVAKNAQSPELLLLLAGAYEQNGQKDVALATYRSVLTKDPNNAAARRNIDRLTK